MRPVALAACTLLLAAVPARAQDAYGFTEERAQRWNGTVLDQLPGNWSTSSGDSVFFFSFKTGTLASGGLVIAWTDDDGSSFRERWVDHQVVGADRWSLRGDGRVHKSGRRAAQLFTSSASQDWVALDVAAGRVHALRRDGVQTSDLDVSAAGTVSLADGGSFFMDVVGVAGTAASLRADGALFVRGQPGAPLFFFAGGENQQGDGDGESLDTLWHRLAVHPATSEVWALRRDGVVQRAPLVAGATPVEVVRLPGQPSTGDITLRRLTYPSFGDWVVLAFAPDGSWAALRGDGSVRGPGGTGAIVERVHYQGADEFDTLFSDLTFLGSRLQAIRRDGVVFRDLVATPFLHMKGAGYIRTALTDVPPDLTDARNAQPTTATYRARLLQGQATAVPVLSTDTDQPAAQLVVMLAGAPPPGVTYEEDTRTFEVSDALPAGRYQLAVRVDDGVAKPRTATHRLDVREPDSDPTRNRKPDVARVARLQALVGVELSVPLVVSDLDGDPVTLTPRLDQGVFALPGSNAAWDEATATLTWTPELPHIGKQQAEFVASDGHSQRRFRLNIAVAAPLVTGEDP